MEDGIHTLAYGHYSLKKLKRRARAGGGQKYIICNRFYISVALFPRNRPIYDWRFPGCSVCRSDRVIAG